MNIFINSVNGVWKNRIVFSAEFLNIVLKISENWS